MYVTYRGLIQSMLDLRDDAPQPKVALFFKRARRVDAATPGEQIGVIVPLLAVATESPTSRDGFLARLAALEPDTYVDVSGEDISARIDLSHVNTLASSRTLHIDMVEVLQLPGGLTPAQHAATS